MFKDLGELIRFGEGGRTFYVAKRVLELPTLEDLTIDPNEMYGKAPINTDSMCLILNAVATICTVGKEYHWQPIQLKKIEQQIRKDKLTEVMRSWEKQVQVTMQTLLEDREIGLVMYRRNLYLLPTKRLVLRLASRRKAA